jgi:2',3'-cyclic-nucleotide 2'-phosphodiesterase/3'-nucleotidase
VKLTGAQILDWLEYAARVFNTIDPAVHTPQALLNRRIPTYNFDIISGLTYAIDVTQPPRPGANGAPAGQAGRIHGLSFEGQPIDPGREFAVVTNSYRADGGGHVPALAHANIILRAPDTNRDAVLRYLRAHDTVPVSGGTPWKFAPAGGAAAYFDTGKPAATRTADVPGLVLMGDGEPGYLRAGIKLV